MIYVFIINFKFLYYAKVQNANQQATMMVCLIGMLLPMCMFAQQITVQGVVKDQTGETVIGASVMEKGTTNGTITGIDGDFSLNMSPNGTLVVSFVGYKTQEVQVKGQKQLQVVLSEDGRNAG